MKIASLVPSWTETLVACGAEVVARTRFCVHPHDQVQKIPAVGGTKDIDWSKLKATGAQFLILDQEENPKSFAEQSPIPYFASHISKIDDLAGELKTMAAALKSQMHVAGNLNLLASRWDEVAKESLRAKLHTKTRSLSDLPGLVDWLDTADMTSPSSVEINSEQTLVYVIWKNPWMAVSPNTFIGSMMNAVGFPIASPNEHSKYPEFQLKDLDPKKTVLLLSTEPFPFAKKRNDLKLEIAGFRACLIDGESYSWFGIRALEFLERHFNSKSR